MVGVFWKIHIDPGFPCGLGRYKGHKNVGLEVALQQNDHDEGAMTEQAKPRQLGKWTRVQGKHPHQACLASEKRWNH